LSSQSTDPDSVRSGIGAAGAWLVFAAVVLAGLLLTAWAHQLVAEADSQRQESDLARAAEQITGLIQGQFSQYETQLTAAQALLAGSATVSRGQWRAFARTFQDHAARAQFFEMAWIPRVPEEQLPWLREQLAAGGIEDFELSPPDRRSFYCPIVYNEPWETHAESLGHDPCAFPTTAPAMNAARESGQPRLSIPLNLIDERGQLVPGYVMFAWSGSGDGQFPGWVSGTIAIDSVFDVVPADRTDMRLVVLDEDAPPERRKVFGEVVPPGGERTLRLERSLYLGGRNLRLEFHQALSSAPEAWMLPLAGTLITLLLAAFLHALLRTRARALSVAEGMTRAYRESEQLLSSVTNNVLEGIYRGDQARGLVYVNQAMASMFGFESTREMIEHAGPGLYARPEQREELWRKLVEHGQYRNEEVEFIRADGSRFTAVNNCVAIRDDAGQVIHFDGVISDITERKRAEEEVHRLAHYDPLTGLPNRSLLNDRIDQALRLSERRGAPLTIMFMDLDRFKTINDSLGHGIGDQLLKAVAERLATEVRDYDTISRLGGDEFILVIPETDADVAAAKASAILEAFKPPFDIEGHELTITPSIGIAVYPDDAGDTETLIRHADAAMYHAKEMGRFTFRFFTPELNARAYERLTLESQLRGALDNGELSLDFQPLVSLADNRVYGAEALLRWQNPTLGQVSPERFIPVAEQSGLIVEIGDWVIDAACRQLAQWHSAGLEALSVAVNLSAVQFWRGNLERTIREALERWKIAPRQLEIELTESVIMQDADAARQILANLKQLGVGLVIDDFGTGYSSLNYLKQFRIDLIKIDRSFVRDVASDPEDAAIVSAILSMARDLRIRVVAEGVETAEQLEFLRSRDCHFVQGFLFAHPMPAERFSAYVLKRPRD
jgi:diguanylate cyclase (GGDEF)-like protein/PAS domain S-box-containing protein